MSSDGKEKEYNTAHFDIRCTDIGYAVLPCPAVLDGEKLSDDNGGGVYDAAKMDSLKVYVGKLCGSF